MLRFTIRDLLWLMVVVGMGFGWLRSEWSLRDERSKCLHIEGDVRDYIEMEDALNALQPLTGNDEKHASDRAKLIQNGKASMQYNLDRAIRRVRRSMKGG